MIQLSQTAKSEIERLKSKQQPNALVRLAVKPGGCSDLFYDMSFDEIVQEGDRTFDVSGLQVLIDNQSLQYVNGLVLDYSEDLMGGGFRFHNPQAVATCSCGNSFSINQQSIIHSP
jgi:iron-sulfur cluster assembly accessory protein